MNNNNLIVGGLFVVIFLFLFVLCIGLLYYCSNGNGNQRFLLKQERIYSQAESTGPEQNVEYTWVYDKGTFSQSDISFLLQLQGVSSSTDTFPTDWSGTNVTSITLTSTTYTVDPTDNKKYSYSQPISAYTPGLYYWARIQAIGQNDFYSAWSNTSSSIQVISLIGDLVAPKNSKKEYYCVLGDRMTLCWLIQPNPDGSAVSFDALKTATFNFQLSQHTWSNYAFIVKTDQTFSITSVNNQNCSIEIDPNFTSDQIISMTTECCCVSKTGSLSWIGLNSSTNTYYFYYINSSYSNIISGTDLLTMDTSGQKAQTTVQVTNLRRGSGTFNLECVDKTTPCYSCTGKTGCYCCPFTSNPPTGSPVPSADNNFMCGTSSSAAIQSQGATVSLSWSPVFTTTIPYILGIGVQIQSGGTYYYYALSDGKEITGLTVVLNSGSYLSKYSNIYYYIPDAGGAGIAGAVLTIADTDTLYIDIPATSSFQSTMT